MKTRIHPTKTNFSREQAAEQIRKYSPNKDIVTYELLILPDGSKVLKRVVHPQPGTEK